MSDRTESVTRGSVSRAARPSTELAPEVKLKGLRWWREVGWRHVVGLIAVAFAIFPVVYIISAAFNPLGSVVATGLIPKSFSLENFHKLLTDPGRPYLRWLGNSLLVAFVVTVDLASIGF